MKAIEDLPIDCDTIEKGQVIPRSKLVVMLGSPSHTAAYRVALVALANALTRQLWKIGKPLTVVIQNNQLSILTDAEASAYNAGFFERSRRKMFKANRQLQAVDTTHFEASDRAAHQRAMVVQGAILGGMNGGRQAVGARAYKRNTPGIETHEMQGIQS